MDIDSGETVQTFQGHEGHIISVAFSPDGKKLVTSSYDKTARIWDVDSGKELQKLAGHTGFVESAVFLPGGKEILTSGSGKSSLTITVNGVTDKYDADDDRTARIWDADSGKELKKLDGYKHIGIDAVLSPDGTKFATVSTRYAENPPTLVLGLVVSDANSGEELCRYEMTPPALPQVEVFMLHNLHMSFSPDGKRLIATNASGSTWLFDVESGKELRRWEGAYQSAVFSPDGKKLLMMGTHRAVLWDVEGLLKSTPAAVGDF